MTATLNAEPATSPPLVGQIARRTRTVSMRDIELFTEISGDRNPLHYDENAARLSRFGELIVQGGVTSGLLNAIVAEQLPGPGSVFLRVDWKFTAPVRPGDEITAEVEVLSAREDKPITELRTTVTRQDCVVALDGTATVWQEPIRRPSVTYRGGMLVLPGAPGIPLCEHASHRRTWTRGRR